MPDIAAVYLKYQKDGLVVLGINAREDDATVKRFVVPLELHQLRMCVVRLRAFPISLSMKSTQIMSLFSSKVKVLSGR